MLAYSWREYIRCPAAMVVPRANEATLGNGTMSAAGLACLQYSHVLSLLSSRPNEHLQAFVVETWTWLRRLISVPGIKCFESKMLFVRSIFKLTFEETRQDTG